MSITDLCVIGTVEARDGIDTHFTHKQFLGIAEDLSDEQTSFEAFSDNWRYRDYEVPMETLFREINEREPNSGELARLVTLYEPQHIITSKGAVQDYLIPICGPVRRRSNMVLIRSRFKEKNIGLFIPRVRTLAYVEHHKKRNGDFELSFRYITPEIL
ncbi:hypothetical protein CONCODRAFT_165645 [Conidiobolus coronatus NRRL 28638]|uniref:Uncharacterized protein n=1 Tax=Conidiobolus coronatus (strain ATCC 28846 / CBS 209.66 / NRRL 28638) TaxID=796925 RepID=A0A137P3K6_CONC2|nr:hypothetical protein CONCODRAFT_165645 [Conidiobolus coronatus NRRL 28638]|eukprot:KXN69578.1 hypothetical protein CONCODRAFT_165645 [Conidiobolus coronatus NRRL 28638]